MFENLPTLAEVEASRVDKPITKGPTRLESKTADRKLTKVTDKDFRQQVWTRDKGHCRCCGRKVQKVLALVPERGEVHHVHGRTGDLRHEVRAALLLCARCHERVTGKVNDKLVIVPSKTFTTKQGTFTDARQPVRFQEAA